MFCWDSPWQDLSIAALFVETSLIPIPRGKGVEGRDFPPEGEGGGGRVLPKHCEWTPSYTFYKYAIWI